MNVKIEATLQSMLTSIKQLSALNSEGRMSNTPHVEKELRAVDDELSDIRDFVEES